jgi:hypothetical protein
MTLVSRFYHMSSVRSTSDGRGPVTRKRVPDREEPGKPRKDARRGRCHPLEAGFWPLWMTPLPRTNITEYRTLAQTPTDWMEDRGATVTDALQSTTFRLYSSAAAPVTVAAAPRHPLPRCRQGTGTKPECRPPVLQDGETAFSVKFPAGEATENHYLPTVFKFLKNNDILKWGPDNMCSRCT